MSGVLLLIKKSSGRALVTIIQPLKIIYNKKEHEQVIINFIKGGRGLMPYKMVETRGQTDGIICNSSYHQSDSTFLKPPPQLSCKCRIGLTIIMTSYI